MSAALPVTTLEAIELLDFDTPLTCDSRSIDGQKGCPNLAELRVMRLKCPVCAQEPVVWLQCRPCRAEDVEIGAFNHTTCGKAIPLEYTVVLGPIRSGS
jgi:hypothetical protein